MGLFLSYSISEYLFIILYPSWQVGLAISHPCLPPELPSSDLSIRVQVYNFNEIHCNSSMRACVWIDKQNR